MTRYAFDCDRCRSEAPANLTVTYADGALAGIRREAVAAGPPTRWRWAPFLPVEAHDAVSLGEGGTPLVLAERLGAELGGATLDQGRVAQPRPGRSRTGSHRW